jgi:hypothetical protein
MNAYKVNAIVTENGLAILERLPLPVGSSVEVIILDNEMFVGVPQLRSAQVASPVENRQALHQQTDSLFPSKDLQPDYLVGISSLMTEWESAADESAYQDL